MSVVVCVFARPHHGPFYGIGAVSEGKDHVPTSGNSGRPMGVVGEDDDEVMLKEGWRADNLL